MKAASAIEVKRAIGLKYVALAVRTMLVVACVIVGSGSVGAQPYPTNPIKLIMPFGVGSPPDSLGRLVGRCLSGQFNQSVVVENRPGAGSSIGAKAAAAALPDGYTLLQVNSALAYAPVLYPNPGYDPITSFAPVAALASWSLLLVVNAELPVGTVRELIDYAKARPGEVNIGHTLGSPPQVLAEMFKKASGAPFNTVAYRQVAELTADLVSGRIHAFFGGGPGLTSLVEQNKLKVLATTAISRDAARPQVPSIAESGFQALAFNPTDWSGLVAPAGTPAPVVEILNRAVNECVSSPDIAANITRQGAEAKILSPSDFATFVADEVRKWPSRVREAGLKPQ